MTTHYKLSISQCIWIVIMFYLADCKTNSAETVRFKRFAGSPGFGKRHDFPADIYPIFRRFSNTGFGKESDNSFGKMHDIHHFPDGTYPMFTGSYKRSDGDSEGFFAGTGFGKRNANGEIFKGTHHE